MSVAGEGSNAVLGTFRVLFGAGTVAGLGDGELLGRFLARRDESAFAALVARHGPMVLGVCRRRLDDPHEVEDAFQATFLVLVRRAGSIRDRDLLGPWLYGVASRVAGRASVNANRRRARERPGAEEAAVGPSGEPECRELRAAIDEELGRLPGKYRDAVVLCDLEGLTHDEAARRLKWPIGTVKTRLTWARQRLRSRLLRRGLAPGAGALLMTKAAEAASDAVPTALAEATVRAAISVAAGRAATAGAVSASVAALTEEVISTMVLTKVKVVAAAVVALGIVSGAGVLAQQPGTPGGGDGDRLREVEHKLDRVLRALEKPPQTTDVFQEPTKGNAPDMVQSGTNSLGIGGDGRMMVRGGGYLGMLRGEARDRLNRDRLKAEAGAIKLLQGSWDSVKETMENADIPRQLEYRRLTFNRSRVVSRYRLLEVGEGRQKEVTASYCFVVNPIKSPAEITIYGDGFLLQGIYEIAGDEMRLAFYGRSEVDRPGTFAGSEVGLPLFVWTFRRTGDGRPPGQGQASQGQTP